MLCPVRLRLAHDKMVQALDKLILQSSPIGVLVMVKNMVINRKGYNAGGTCHLYHKLSRISTSKAQVNKTYQGISPIF